MNFPASHPLWMWLYFGTFASIGVILVMLIVWNWLKHNALAKGYQRTAAKWNVVGYLFLFFAAWFACGIGGAPGNLLSSDPTTHNLPAGTVAAALSMFFSLPGWLCVLMGQRRMLREVQSEKG